MIDNTLNKDRAEALFNTKAILINGRDVIEEKEAIDLLGKTAFDFAVKHTEDATNGYGIGSYTLFYMTKKAFFLGITYRNIEIIAQTGYAPVKENQRGGGASYSPASPYRSGKAA